MDRQRANTRQVKFYRELRSSRIGKGPGLPEQDTVPPACGVVDMARVVVNVIVARNMLIGYKTFREEAESHMRYDITVWGSHVCLRGENHVKLVSACRDFHNFVPRRSNLRVVLRGGRWGDTFISKLFYHR